MKMLKISKGFFSNGVEFNNVTAPLVEEPVVNVKQVPGVKHLRRTAVIDTSNVKGVSRQRKNTRVFFGGPADYEIIDGISLELDNISQVDPVVTVDFRSEAEIAEDIADRFETLNLLSTAAANTKIRSMIVSGSPGTGKTYEVEQAMKAQERKNPEFRFTHIKGSVSAVGLYVQLYQNRDGVVILDDADQVLTDLESIQLIKAATESTKNRLITWKKFSNTLEQNNVPQEFTFTGCVIILTNTDLENGSKSKAPHWEAIISRAHYINVVLRSDLEKIIRIFQIIDNSNILTAYIPKEKHQEVKDFIRENSNNFRELSVRTVVKIAELCSTFPAKWKMLAGKTMKVS